MCYFIRVRDEIPGWAAAATRPLWACGHLPTTCPFCLPSVSVSASDCLPLARTETSWIRAQGLHFNLMPCEDPKSMQSHTEVLGSGLQPVHLGDAVQPISPILPLRCQRQAASPFLATRAVLAGGRRWDQACI